MADTIIKVHVSAQEAAEVADLIRRRLSFFSYIHRIEMDEQTQIDAVLEAERHECEAEEERRAARNAFSWANHFSEAYDSYLEHNG